MSKESAFQKRLIDSIKEMLPGAIVLKNDSSYIQGIPDLLVLYNDKWAALECKKDKKAKKQPNQEYYISSMNDMSYAAFIFPENEREVLDALQQALEPRR